MAQKATSLFNLALAMQAEGQLEEACGMYEQVVAINADYHDAWCVQPFQDRRDSYDLENAGSTARIPLVIQTMMTPLSPGTTWGISARSRASLRVRWSA